MVNIYFAGSEDTEMYTFTGTVSTTSGEFRSSYSRCAYNPGNNGTWHSNVAFNASTFWSSGWTTQGSSSGGNTTNNVLFMGWYDSSDILRLGIVGTGSFGTFKMMKYDSGGSGTQLGSNFTLPNIGGQLMKLDVFIDNSATGTVTIYIASVNSGAVNRFTYSGDTTTNGVTNLAYIVIGSPNQSGAFNTFKWSEIIVADTDTRSWNLQTLAPVANGNTHNFDTGTPAAANVNEITLSDATLDGSTTNGQIDQYTIPALATGTFTIIAVGVSARMQKGATGPSKMDLGVRSGGTDYWSSDQTLTTTWAAYSNWWTTDPNTAGTWAALPSNIGLKAVT